MDVAIHCNLRDCHWSKFGRAVSNRLSVQSCVSMPTVVRIRNKNDRLAVRQCPLMIQSSGKGS